MPKLDLSELDDDVRERVVSRLGIKDKKRRNGPSLSKDDVRSYALRAMNALAGLTPAQRTRVIAQMLKLNKV